MFGLTQGTRHYIQYDLDGNGTFEDLLFQDSETGESKGLWCSRAMRTAADRIAELIAENGTQPSQYRIVTRTWHEETRAYDPNHGKAFNDPSYDYDADPDEDKLVDADLETEGEPNEPKFTIDEDPEPPVNTPVADPTK